MIIGTVESSFVFWRPCCVSALLSVNTTAPWSLLALLKIVFFCGGSVVLRHCWELVHQCRKECYSTMPTFDNFFGTADQFIIFRQQCSTSALLMASTSVPKKCYSTMPTFDDFWALLNFFYFPASRLYSALLMAGTTVPKQRFFISVKVWWLVALLEIVFFFRRQWCNSALMSASTSVPKRMPFNNDNFWYFWALLNLIFFTAAMVYFGAVDG